MNIIETARKQGDGDLIVGGRQKGGMVDVFPRQASGQLPVLTDALA
jgi:hypothetical protein